MITGKQLECLFRSSNTFKEVVRYAQEGNLTELGLTYCLNYVADNRGVKLEPTALDEACKSLLTSFGIK